MSNAPTLENTDIDVLVSQIADEFLERLRRGERPVIEDYTRRHPQIARVVEQVLRSVEVMGSLEVRPSTLPGVGAAVELPPNGGPAAGAGPTSGQLGDFRILREIGRGGMGVVYEAEQVSLRRRVALKMLPFAAVMDSRQLLRFQNEALAAASLKHPNIVQVYSVGCERGVHYYAMEYVEGQTLAEVIEQLRETADAPKTEATLAPTTPLAPEPRTLNPEPSSLAPDTRAALSTERVPQAPEFFRSVATWGIQAAEALEHAHQLGVVHRDVKPSNLLIDANGHLLITDFGLAQTQTGANLTMTGDVLGTLRYMSPEQAQGNRRVLDHRTDIYSLGVTLYELLALRPPFLSADRHALIHEIVDGSPPPPRQLNRSIPRDLETIVLKAIAAEPQARYATAQQLADDLKRFLADEPIRARRPSLVERAAKWARRHRAVTWSAVAALLVCAVTVAVSAIVVFAAYRGEKEQRKIAAANAVKAEANAVKAEANAVKAEENYKKARRAVDEMYTGVAEKWLGQQAKLTEVQRDFLEKALAFYQEFSEEKGSDPQVRNEAVLALQRVGAIQEKLGKLAAAETAFAQSVKESKDLVLQHPEQPEFRLALAWGQIKLANIWRKTGRTKDADQQADRVNQDLTKLATASFKDAKHRQRLAEALVRLCGELTLAHRLPEAEDAARSTLKTWESLVGDFPADIEYRYGLAEAYSSQGRQRMWWGGRNEEAEASLREAEARLSKLQDERPDDVRFRSSLSGALLNLGVIMGWEKRYEEEEKVTGRALKLYEGLVQDFPDVPGYHNSLGIVLENLARNQGAQGRSLECEKHGRIALGVYEKLADRHPDVPEYEFKFGCISELLAFVLTEQERYGEARQISERALARAKKALKANPAQRGLMVNAMNCSSELARNLIDLGDHASAAQAIEYRLSLNKSYEFNRDRPDEKWDTNFFVGHILMTCASLAERDSTLSPAERKKAVQTYTDQASVWIKEATRAAEEWARNELKDSKTPGSEVAARGEISIRHVEQIQHRADFSANRRDADKFANFFGIKALIKEAIARAPDDPTQNYIADLLTSAPEGPRDRELALKLARRAVELKPGDGMCAQSLGWALYRAGDWKGSIELIQKRANNLESHFVLAMAYWQLGEKTDAKARFDRANEWLKLYERRCEERLKQGVVIYPPPSLLKRFQAEAAALLGVPNKPPAGKEKTEQKPKAESGKRKADG